MGLICWNGEGREDDLGLCSRSALERAWKMIVLDYIMDRDVPRVFVCSIPHPPTHGRCSSKALSKNPYLTALPEPRRTSYGVVTENTNTKSFINQILEIEITSLC